MARSRSPHRESQWIAKQVAMLGRYPQRRPKDLRVTADGHMYLDNLMQAWGYQEKLEQYDILAALRKHSYRQEGDETEQRFTIITTMGGRSLIKVSPKNPQIRRPLSIEYIGAASEPCKQECKDAVPQECKDEVLKAPDVNHGALLRNNLDMSLDEIMWRESETSQPKGNIRSMSLDEIIREAKERENCHYASSNRTTQMARTAQPVATLSGKSGSAEPGKVSAHNTADQQRWTAEDERSIRVRRKMEQMGLTPNTAHLRLAACHKASRDRTVARETNTCVVDSSPSPPPSRGMPVDRNASATNEDEDEDLAARAARSFNVSGDLQNSEASGTGIRAHSEPPPKPPGANWEQYADSESSEPWFYWPGPGGQWWCGPHEKDTPRPYTEPASE